ncbi:MAG: CDP-alcohol phosphatidyltransferase family protein [Bacilli bacterium]
MKEINNVVNSFINDFKDNLKTFKKDYNIKKQIPNLLTFSRALAPAFIIPLALSGNIIGSLIASLLFATTDLFDGLLARKFKATSDFGRKLDPICDKIFAIGITLPLIITNPYLIITASLEGLIAFVSIKSATKNNDPRSTMLGKIKTTILSLTLALTYLSQLLHIPLNIIYTTLTVTGIFQLGTALQYHKIDKKKDNLKETLIKPSNITKKESFSNTKQEIIEYKHLKESLLNKETDEPEKTIGSFKSK